ncbi:response regulator [Palleronia sediminis]|uniref:Response regulator n=1 Tax=Palleronia sediminis TaxID=2547833 RepID=A0A4R6A9W3_9RHOB|nr:response regulator [Palleronia sediminis]TDL79695.1 response regulator [Palleronia sediminis]
MGDTRTVLLVEDEPNIIEAVRFILTRGGFHVATHSDGADAAEAVRVRRPDLVILDVMLPNRSGFDILEDLRGGDDPAAVPILMLTARGQTREREMALRLGATQFMTKPFSNAEMLEAVRALCAAPQGDAP